MSSCLEALLSCGTANDWSTLDAVSAKVSRKMGRQVSPRELDNVLVETGDERLQTMGVWRTSFGKKYMPIICVNKVYGRSMRALLNTGEKVAIQCTCRATLGKNEQEKSQRYFGSHDYAAGRHVSTKSAHRANCLMWRPSTSSHLHSWRRGFTDNSVGGTRKKQ